MRRLGIPILCAAALGVAACGEESTSDMSTADVLNEVQPGMTHEAVDDALGEPELQMSEPNHMPLADPTFQTLTVYGYDTSDAKAVVVFHDDVVYDVHGTDRIQVVPDN